MKDRTFKYILVIPTIILLIALSIIPLIYSLAWSFSAGDITEPIKGFVGIENYRSVVVHERFQGALPRTILVIIVAVCIEMILGLGMAFAMNNIGRFRRALVSISLLPTLIAPIIVGWIWFVLLWPMGLINWINKTYFGGGIIEFFSAQNAIFTLIWTDIWSFTPFVMLVFIAGLAMVPENLVEAATIDGASSFRVFRHISLHYLKPVIIVIILLRVIDIWNNGLFAQAYLMTHGGPGSATETLVYWLYHLAFEFWKLGEASAMSYLMLIVASIFVYIFFKIVREETEKKKRETP